MDLPISEFVGMLPQEETEVIVYLMKGLAISNHDHDVVW